jgi:methylmalonyl-CoA/ethylmalonyl-CoA epimerase
MTQRPLFRTVSQVALVVKSVEATAKRCWDDFGIGPWKFYTYDPSTVSEMTVGGRRVDHAMRVGIAMIGEVEWEIIEPLDERSIYAEHLRTHGEGLHHVLFGVDDYESAKARICGAGFSEVGGGRWFGFPYSYFDTERSLGCIAEIWAPPAAGESMPPHDGTYP